MTTPESTKEDSLWERLQLRKRDISLERAIYMNSPAYRRRFHWCQEQAIKDMKEAAKS